MSGPGRGAGIRERWTQFARSMTLGAVLSLEAIGVTALEAAPPPPAIERFSAASGDRIHPLERLADGRLITLPIERQSIEAAMSTSLN